MPTYKLPDLPYDYSALEPHISAKVLQNHHDKHHAAYVKGANDTLDALADARQKNDFSRIAALEKALAFHVSGHVMHSIFWQNMSPNGGGKPTGELASAIDRDFGSFDSFKAQLTAAAMTIMGSGWGVLAYEPLSKRLVTTQVHDHQAEVTQGGIPLLVIDGWEHAWYLQYGPDKKSFFDAVWNTWNWKDVAQRLAAAQKLDLVLKNATV